MNRFYASDNDLVLSANGGEGEELLNGVVQNRACLYKGSKGCSVNPYMLMLPP